jgi:hypothetical protein
MSFLRRSCRLLLAVSAVLAAADARAESGIWPRVYIQNVRTAAAVRKALDGAVRRLTHERCQALLAEFRDQEGRPLTVKLAELGPGTRDYLELLLFQDGSEAKRCDANTLAFTGPGHRVVFICSQNFQHTGFSNGPLAEAIVIHEMLHTLGLGENPPSSHTITRRVLGQCSKG